MFIYSKKAIWISMVFFFFFMIYAQGENKIIKNIFDQEYASTLIHLIQKAKVSIYAVHLSFSIEEGICHEIMQEMVAAAKRGVKITMLLEGKKRGLREKNARTEKKFQESGIKVVLNQSRRVAHAKIFVVDSEWVLAGSTNLTNSSIQKNHEANLLIQSPAIAQSMEKYAQELVNNSDREISIESETDSQIKAITDTKFFLHALDMIQNAKQEICITTYLMDYSPDYPDSSLYRLFMGLIDAHKRGVKIRIFLEQSTFLFNDHIHEKNLESAQFLKSQGIVSTLFDKEDQITHSKIILVDKKKALLGSTNWYSFDLDFGHQVNFVIENDAIVHGLAEYFDELYKTGVIVK
ncbi:MAG: hypothetical protein HUU50_22865 [Candidatus Brocadiae bacterium]|nr:hypothetical protein [Candidatus Brocadiia bacterium]